MKGSPMTGMSILDSIPHARVQFDVTNPEHIIAAGLLIAGRQHPTIRFSCDPKFTNVRDMILNKLAVAYIEANLDQPKDRKVA